MTAPLCRQGEANHQCGLTKVRIYEDEGHVLLRGIDVADYWRRQLDFLATQLHLVRDPDGAVVFDTDRARR
jgi:hypothetical protein